MVLVPDAGRVFNVASLQWSDLCCDITTASGGGRSASDVMAGGLECLTSENLEWYVWVSPISHGSHSTVNFCEGADLLI